MKRTKLTTKRIGRIMRYMVLMLLSTTQIRRNQAHLQASHHRCAFGLPVVESHGMLMDYVIYTRLPRLPMPEGTEGCAKVVQSGGLCKRHNETYCSVKGCTNV